MKKTTFVDERTAQILQSSLCFCQSHCKSDSCSNDFQYEAYMNILPIPQRTGQDCHAFHTSFFQASGSNWFWSLVAWTDIEMLSISRLQIHHQLDLNSYFNASQFKYCMQKGALAFRFFITPLCTYRKGSRTEEDPRCGRQLIQGALEEYQSTEVHGTRWAASKSTKRAGCCHCEAAHYHL